MRGLKMAAFGVLLWLIGLGGGFFAGRGWEMLHPAVPRTITVQIARADTPMSLQKCENSPCDALCLFNGRMVFQLCPNDDSTQAPTLPPDTHAATPDAADGAHDL
jgi:hypothetical protein